MVESQDFDVAPKQRAFLAAYRLTVTITRAAGVAQMHRSTVNVRWIREYMRFENQR
jgi:hypothetical protein